MEIHIITKNVYGNDLFYVKDPNQASVVRRLTGRKTVSRLDIDMLVRLDVKVLVSEEAQEALGWNAEEAGAKSLAPWSIAEADWKEALISSRRYK